MPSNNLFVVISIFLFGYLALLFSVSSRISSNFFITSFNKSPNEKNKIAITFDDGPDTINTPLILDLLDKYNAKATFFIVGNKMENNYALTRDIYRRNHIIGNHSYTHSYYFPLKTVRNIKLEITKTNQIIKKVTGHDNIFFRPPFGVTNPSIAKATKELKMKIIGWSIRSLDTKNENAELVFQRIIKKLKVGDIVLLHDTSKNILEILEKLLLYLKDNNIKAVTIIELKNDFIVNY